MWYYRYAGWSQRWAQTKVEAGEVQAAAKSGKISFGKTAVFLAELLGLFYVGEVIGRVKVDGIVGYPIGEKYAEH